MKKRILSMLLAVVLMAGVLPLGSGAQSQPSIISIAEGEQLSVSGVLTERYYEINSSNKGVAFILKLDESISVQIDSDEDNSQIIEISEIQINFSDYYSQTYLENLLNTHIAVTGTTVMAHTGHHLTPIVLTDGEIALFSSNDESYDIDLDNEESLDYDFSIEEIVILTVHLPKSWEGHVKVERESSLLTFYSSANYETEFIGNLFTIGAWTNDEWKEMPRRGLLKTVVINGKTYYIVWYGPTDVRYNYNDSNCKEEYTMMEKDIGNIIEGITFSENISDENISFVDVPSDAWYYEFIQWAVNEGITSGTDKTHFSPSSSCTRAQAVTFLWRAAGSPNVSGSNPFSDVPSSAYYYKAVLWAVRNGITSGTSATKFSPDETCTRAQIVTFLYRSAGTPSVSTNNSFNDVSSSQYYYKAVQWAKAEGIAAGTGNGKFSPDSYCTRAQIVTFLYQAYA